MRWKDKNYGLFLLTSCGDRGLALTIAIVSSDVCRSQSIDRSSSVQSVHDHQWLLMSYNPSSIVRQWGATTAMLLVFVMVTLAAVVDGICVTSKTTIGLSSLNFAASTCSESGPTSSSRWPLKSVGYDDDLLENDHHPSGCDQGDLVATPSHSWSGQFLTSRRQALDVSSRGGMLGLLTAGVMPWSVVPPNAMAAGDGAFEAASAISSRDILSRLTGIPTFCIVDGDTGVPYMIFDGQSIATGYFFLSFQVASGVLQDARDKDPKGRAVWDTARITVVPLSVALQVALSKRLRTAVNGGATSEGVQFKTYSDIVPSEEGVADAKAVAKALGQNPEKWSQKGRVPLFYMEGLTLPSSSSRFAGMEPRYFNMEDLVQEWNRQNPGNIKSPPIQVVEFIELFRVAVTKNDWSALANIAIMPVQESNKVAVELMKAQRASGVVMPYSLDKAFLVGSSKS
jgi:hypothetical protein